MQRCKRWCDKEQQNRYLQNQKHVRNIHQKHTTNWQWQHEMGTQSGSKTPMMVTSKRSKRRRTVTDSSPHWVQHVDVWHELAKRTWRFEVEQNQKRSAQVQTRLRCFLYHPEVWDIATETPEVSIRSYQHFILNVQKCAEHNIGELNFGFSCVFCSSVSSVSHRCSPPVQCPTWWKGEIPGTLDHIDHIDTTTSWYQTTGHWDVKATSWAISFPFTVLRLQKKVSKIVLHACLISGSPLLMLGASLILDHTSWPKKVWVHQVHPFRQHGLHGQNQWVSCAAGKPMLRPEVCRIPRLSAVCFMNSQRISTGENALRHSSTPNVLRGQSLGLCNIHRPAFMSKYIKYILYTSNTSCFCFSSGLLAGEKPLKIVGFVWCHQRRASENQRSTVMRYGLTWVTWKDSTFDLVLKMRTTNTQHTWPRNGSWPEGESSSEQKSHVSRFDQAEQAATRVESNSKGKAFLGNGRKIARKYTENHWYDYINIMG